MNQKFTRKKRAYKAKKLAFTMFVLQTFMLIQSTVYAAADPFTGIDNLNTLLLGLLGKIGILILVWGAGKFAMSLKNQDSNSQEQAFLWIGAGSLLIAIEPVVGLITG